MIILPEDTPEERAAAWAKIVGVCMGLLVVLLFFRKRKNDPLQKQVVHSG